MKKFLEELSKETLWGGIFGAIAIIAIVAELILNGISIGTIVGAVKDIAGTIVSVMVFVFAIKHLMSKLKEIKTFEEHIEKALMDWQKNHSSMVVRDETYDIEHEGEPASCFSLALKTNLNDFYLNKDTKEKGWFVRMPMLTKSNYNKGDITIKFHLNKGTFFEGIAMSNEELNTKFKMLNDLFSHFINTNDKIKGYAEATKGKNNKYIVVKINKPIETVDDINDLVLVIDTMYNAYLVAANLHLK